MKRKVLTLLLVLVLSVLAVGCTDDILSSQIGDYLTQSDNSDKTTVVSSDDLVESKIEASSEIASATQISSQEQTSSQSKNQGEETAMAIHLC